MALDDGAVGRDLRIACGSDRRDASLLDHDRLIREHLRARHRQDVHVREREARGVRLAREPVEQLVDAQLHLEVRPALAGALRQGARRSTVSG
jgi:hypothetical protein